MHPWINEAVTDMCCYNKRRPDTGNLVKKPTKLCGTKEILQNPNHLCNATHKHDRIEGSMKVPYNESWKTMKTCVWAGTYTEEFAEAILHGAELYLQEKFERNGNVKVNATFPADGFPIPVGEPGSLHPPLVEEAAMHPDPDEETEDIQNWSEEELPKDKRADLLIKVPKDV